MSKSTVQLIAPLRVLSRMIGKTIVVRLRGGVSVRGTLASYDSCMNLIIDGAEEVDHVTSEVLTKYGRIVVRGSQVIYVSTEELAL